MRMIQTQTIKGEMKEPVYAWNEPSYAIIGLSETVRHRRISYLNIPVTFDIETTTIYERDDEGELKFRPYAFMYQWQFGMRVDGENIVVFGRTWEEFEDMIYLIIGKMNLSETRKLVVYVHNLSYEFSFLYRFFDMTEVFCLNSRKVAKATMCGCIELRDSYVLSNMSLSKFCENTPNVIHYKLTDTYDYNKIRTPKTPLTEEEEAYCYNDVAGLCECIEECLKEYNIANIPLTSTGYIRREYRERMNENPKNRKRFIETRLTPELYTLLKEGFRGGDTHASLRWSGQVIENVDSFDISSSYPASLMTRQFPITPFVKANSKTFFARDWTGYAYIFRIRLTNVRYIGITGNPYLPFSKCRKITPDRILDNGRVLYAGIVETTFTDIDWAIFKGQYLFDDMYVKDTYVSKYGELSKEFKGYLMELFTKKTVLKGIEEKEYEYLKSKNKLNGSYGMMVTDIVRDSINFDALQETPFTIVKTESKDEMKAMLDRFYKSRNNFLCYQDGVWTTAHSRMRLQVGMSLVGRDNIYNDTDSIKAPEGYREAFNKLNETLRQEAIDAGAYAEDKNGNVQYMGVWDCETEKKGSYLEFKTLGSKKYIINKNGHYLTTIAGVSKAAGEGFFNKVGIDAFQYGMKIPNSGHLTGFFNDDFIHKITIDDGVTGKCTFTTASNYALIEGGYELGATEEYINLVKAAKEKKEFLN